jgi:hypothetical protein
MTSGMAQASLCGSTDTWIGRSAAISAFTRSATRSYKSAGHLGQVNFHLRGQWLHVAAGHQRAEVAEHHPG